MPQAALIAIAALGTVGSLATGIVSASKKQKLPDPAQGLELAADYRERQKALAARRMGLEKTVLNPMGVTPQPFGQSKLFGG